MSPERIQQNFEQKPNIEQEQYVIKSFEIISPSQEDFEQSSIEKLRELWRENHEKLKKLLCDSHPPYFGLHGTNQQAFHQIEASHRCSVEIATFYKKEYEFEQFIYRLYHSALYVSIYANRKHPGRILVFDLEKSGKNITNPWENLKPGNSLPTLLTGDSKKERQCFSTLNKSPEELLWRSDLSLMGENFDERFVGSIDFGSNELSQYISELKEMWRFLIRNRFMSQEIIVQTLQLLTKKKSKTDKI